MFIITFSCFTKTRAYSKLHLVQADATRIDSLALKHATRLTPALLHAGKHWHFVHNEIATIIYDSLSR
jgi:hypothetical protein